MAERLEERLETTVAPDGFVHRSIKPHEVIPADRSENEPTEVDCADSVLLSFQHLSIKDEPTDDVHLPVKQELAGNVKVKCEPVKDETQDGKDLCSYRPESIVISVAGDMNTFGVFVGDEKADSINYAAPFFNFPTCNRSELQAAIMGIDAAQRLVTAWPKLKNCALKEVVIQSNCRYVVQGLTEWKEWWTTHGWTKKGDGNRVANQELWQEFMMGVDRLSKDVPRIYLSLADEDDNRCARSLAESRKAKQWAAQREAYYGYDDYEKKDCEYQLEQEWHDSFEGLL